MSESTVKSHIAQIYQKLGAANRAQALVTAMRIGLLSTSLAAPDGPLTAAVRSRSIGVVPIDYPNGPRRSSRFGTARLTHRTLSRERSWPHDQRTSTWDLQRRTNQ